MEIQKVKQSGIFIVRLQGRLDAYQAGHLADELEETIRSGEHHIRLDMKDVPFMSSAGIGILLKYFQSLRKLGGSFGVVTPSEAVRSVLEMAGLKPLLAAAPAEEAPPPTAPAAETAAAEERRFGAVRCLVYSLDANAKLDCRLLGDPGRLEYSGFREQDVCPVKLGKDALAVGLGAFGEDFTDSRARFGEFLAAAGAAACLPSDRAKVPDYMLSTGSLVPHVQTLYALVAEGRMGRCVRFETGEEEPPIPLSDLVEIAFDVTGDRTVGLAMIAEPAGLLGAALKHSPALGDPDESLFSHPGVRRRLRFTPERLYDRALALVVGVATRAADTPGAAFLRPLGDGATPLGHFHAAAFAYKALSKGLISLEDTVASLFEEKTLLGILHLINDNREISGAGQSLFIRGAMWVSPVARMVKEEL